MSTKIREKRSLLVKEAPIHSRDGVFLSSRAVTSQVLSTETSLTTVFGMGTGGPSS